ncbi:hypothetical protein JD76_00372 [Micromonospora endolithica]|nr:hypothetical protein JD76_00372 [Micromonospora endolithica]
MRWVRRLALAGIVWCAGLLATLTPLEGIPLPTPIALSGVLLALPIFAITTFAIRRTEIRETGRARRSLYWVWRLLRDTMPGWLLIASWLLFAGFLVVGGDPGPPVQELGAETYAAQIDGRWTAISKSEYLPMKAQNQRIHLSVPGGFCVFTAVLSTALLRREAQQREAVRSDS